MANIEQYLTEIEVATYGEEVRTSIVEALRAQNDETEATTETANEAKSTSESAVNTANQAVSTASEAVSEAADAAASAAESAAESAASAESAAETIKRTEAAANAAQDAADEANTAATAANQAAQDAWTQASDATAAANSANEAAEAANEAAESANDAAEKATDAADTATSSAEYADTQAERAKDAADQLDGVIEDANEAIQNANDAADNANTAATDVEDATERANDAADEANAAASRVEEAIQKAESAVESADEAIARADVAADKAENAVTNIQDSLDKMDQAVETAQEAVDEATKAVEAVEGAADAANAAAEEARKAAEDIEKYDERIAEAEEMASAAQEACEQSLFTLEARYAVTAEGESYPDQSDDNWDSEPPTELGEYEVLWMCHKATRKNDEVAWTTPCIVDKYLNLDSVIEQINELEKKAIVSEVMEFAQTDTSETCEGATWSTTPPTWEDGKYSWIRTVTTYGDGNEEISEGICITGNTGAQGEKGIDGDAATIEVGSVTTGDPGTDVSVVNSGTTSNAVFDFEIPQGLPYASNVLRGTNSTKLISSATTWEDGTWRIINGSGSVRTAELIDVSVDNANIKYGVECYTESGTTYAKIRQDGVPMMDGVTYTISAYAKGNGKLQFQYGMSPYISENIDITSSWERYSYTFTFDGSTCGSTEGYTWIYVGGGSAGTIDICGIKLEIGPCMTVWTPNEYDMKALVESSYDSSTKNLTLNFAYA